MIAPLSPAAAATPFKSRLLSISCVSKTLCRATVRSGVVQRWDGHQWQPGFQFTDAASVDSISCATTEFCAAVETVKVPGEQIQDYRPVTRNANGTWDTSVAPVAIPDNAVFFGAMSCTSASFCMFVSCASSTMCKAVDDPEEGNRPVYSWNGSSWSVRRVLPDIEQTLALSCPSVSFCMLITGLHYVILSGSHIFARKHLPHRIGVGGLSCTSSSFCIGVNSGADGSNCWDGKSWHGPHAFTKESYLFEPVLLRRRQL